MAEKVGDVYVTVHADNSRLRNELKAAAAKDGKAYANEFDRVLASEFDKIAARNRQKLAEAFATGDFSKFEKEMGSVAGAVRKVDDEVNHLIEHNQISLKQAREIKKAVNEWAVPKAMKDDVRRISVDLSKVHDEALSMDRAMRRSGKAISTSMSAIHTEALKVARDMRIAEARAKKFGTVAKDGAEAGERGFRRMLPMIENVTARVGKIFGKGSRNDFANIVGSLIGGMVTLFTTPLKIIPAVTENVASLADGFKEMAKNIGAAERNAGNLAAALGEFILQNLNPAGLAVIGVTVAAVAATIGVATTAIFAALNLAAAAVSVLAGMFLSLASAAAFAMAGALLPLVPVLLSLAAPLGLLVGLMQDFNKTAKEQPRWVKDIKSAWDKSTATISKAKDQVGKALAGFFPVLTGIWNPLVAATATAMTGIIKNLSSILKDPAMKRFIKAFETTLPEIFTSLGLGMNQVLRGLLAFFAPILPFAQQLADAFERVSKKFADWASSAKGQNQIGDFMDKAWAAATKLWDILVQLGGIIGTVFGAGQQNGQDFLDTLDSLLTKFNEWLKSPEGQTALRQFFDDAKEAARKMGEVIKAAFDLFDSLDTSGSRDSLGLLIDSITEVVKAFGGMILAGTEIATFLWPVFKAFVTGVVVTLGTIITAAAIAFGWVPGLGPKLTAAATQFAQFAVGVQKDLDEMDTDIQVTVDAAKAMTEIGSLKAAMNGLTDKTVVVTNEIRFVVKGKSPGGGTVTAGGSTKDTATGGLFNGPTIRRIGEAGPEAVVPLNRPLSLVDPAVRALSAFAQGIPQMASGGIVGGGRNITVAEGAIVVNSPSANPTHVAMSVLDRLTAAAI